MRAIIRVLILFMFIITLPLLFINEIKDAGDFKKGLQEHLTRGNHE